MAMGQVEQSYLIDTGLPDVNGKQRANYAGQRILLIGVSLQALAESRVADRIGTR